MRNRVAASALDKKGSRASISTAHVDVTLRIGTGPAGTEGLDEAAIADMATWLGLTGAVVERAKEVFRKVEGARVKAWSGIPGWTKLRSKDPMHAACLSIACRIEGTPRSLKELASATAEGSAAVRKEIARLTKHIRKLLGEEVEGQGTGVGVVRPSGYLRRFCQLLGLGSREAAVVTEAARRLEESDLEIPHLGGSIAAAIVCLALERVDAHSHRPDIVRDVAAATGITTATINLACKKLRPHAELLFG